MGKQGEHDQYSREGDKKKDNQKQGAIYISCNIVMGVKKFKEQVDPEVTHLSWSSNTQNSVGILKLTPLIRNHKDKNKA